MNPITKLKQRLFPKGVRRWLLRQRNRVANRTSEAALRESFERLRLPAGAVICIHARLSSLGYLPGGPASVLKALEKAVPRCTIVMPTFPFGGSMADYVASDQVYDPLHTPSASGLLSEALRTFPGAVRSLHPTHPCAAVGPEAERLIQGSERSATPFGDESGYGRYTRAPNAYQLLIGTNSTSIVHRFQELAEWPNLFLPGEREVRGLDHRGRLVTCRVRVHVPRVPLYVAVPDGNGGYQYVWMPHYCLLFPDRVRQSVLQRLRRKDVAEALLRRDEAFLESGVFTRSKCRDTELLAIRVDRWLPPIVEELAQNVHQHADAYAREAIEACLARGEEVS
ncbi:hypothetical protein JCM30394_27950 [Deferrisoma palaeochoriense]